VRLIDAVVFRQVYCVPSVRESEVRSKRVEWRTRLWTMSMQRSLSKCWGVAVSCRVTARGYGDLALKSEDGERASDFCYGDVDAVVRCRFPR